MREYSPAYLPNTVNNLNEIKKKTDCNMDRSRSTIYHTKRNTLSTHDPQLSSSFNFNEIKPEHSSGVFGIQNLLFRILIVVLILNLTSMRLNQTKYEN